MLRTDPTPPAIGDPYFCDTAATSRPLAYRNFILSVLAAGPAVCIGLVVLSSRGTLWNLIFGDRLFILPFASSQYYTCQ